MITIVVSETKRSLEYLIQLVKYKIHIKKIILYTKVFGDVYKFIKKKKILNKLVLIKSKNVNAIIIYKKFILYKSKINLISTYPGQIVKNHNLLKYNLIHCHPGNLPMFKGSTTIYYSIILKKKICVSLLKINRNIDSGLILYKKFFKKPRQLSDIEKNYDNKIRAATLISYLKKKKKIKFNQFNKNYLPYYIAHPIIRQIVLNKNYLK